MARWSISQLLLREGDTHTTLLPLESIFAPEAPIPFLLKEVKLTRFILSHVTFFLSPFALEIHQNVSR